MVSIQRDSFRKGTEPGLISYGRRNSVYAAVHKETNSKRNYGAERQKGLFASLGNGELNSVSGTIESSFPPLPSPGCRFIHLTRRGKRIDDRIARIRSLAFCAAALKQLNQLDTGWKISFLSLNLETRLLKVDSLHSLSFSQCFTPPPSLWKLEEILRKRRNNKKERLFLEGRFHD